LPGLLGFFCFDCAEKPVHVTPNLCEHLAPDPTELGHEFVVLRIFPAGQILVGSLHHAASG
jgi:hypothetical protein